MGLLAGIVVASTGHSITVVKNVLVQEVKEAKTTPNGTVIFMSNHRAVAVLVARLIMLLAH